jgi:hypothetical protein
VTSRVISSPRRGPLSRAASPRPTTRRRGVRRRRASRSTRGG